MIIKVLDQKYKCGCDRGLAEVNYPGILYNLNSIIEWENSEFPLEVVEEVEVQGPGADDIETTYKIPIYKENRKFLGDDPELVPGNCFLVDGQVIAIDSGSRLILVLSETGRNSLDRFIEERFVPEMKLVKEDTMNIKSLVWEDLTTEPNLEEYSKKIIIPYPIYKIWKDKFVVGKDLKVHETTGKLNIKIDLIYNNFPISFVFRDWDVLYREEDFEEDEEDLLKELLDKVMSYLFMSCDRVCEKKPELSKDEQIESFMKNIK